MSKTVYEPTPRYVVETANTLPTLTGGRVQGAWNFAYAFDLLRDAQNMAVRMAEDNEYVRVIDRADNEENK